MFICYFAAPCGGHLTAPSGIILSPGWPGYYKDSLNCEWVIEARPRHTIKITFDRFQTEVNYDTLEVRDGSVNSAPLIGEYHGTQAPQFLISTGNFMYLIFMTDNSRSSVGFQIRYETACGGNVTGPAGVILSPNFPQPYPHGKECDWRIKVNPDYVIALIFKSHDPLCLPPPLFNMEPSYDFLHIYEGEDSNSPLIGSFQGSQSPERIESSGNSLFLAFRSDASVSMAGFAIDKSCQFWTYNYPLFAISIYRNHSFSPIC
uniref:CUB domain-containing protein n=1 Tax=Callorhinchus milii TaxID=7868 RepID=A0A4W3K4R6_CALMI